MLFHVISEKAIKSNLLVFMNAFFELEWSCDLLGNCSKVLMNVFVPVLDINMDKT